MGDATKEKIIEIIEDDLLQLMMDLEKLMLIVKDLQEKERRRKQ